MVGNDGLGNGGADGIDLGSHTTTLYADADIEVSELVLTKDKDGLEGLEPEGLGLNELNGLAIDLDEAAALLGEGACCRRLFPKEGSRSKGKRKVRGLEMSKSIVVVVRRLLPSPLHRPLGHDTLPYHMWHITYFGSREVGSTMAAILWLIINSTTGAAHYTRCPTLNLVVPSNLLSENLD